MSDQSDAAWVTLATYNWVAEAHVLRTLLQDEGIEVLIPEEFSAGVLPHLTAMTVRVQVREKDAARARALQAELGTVDEADLAAAAASAGPGEAVFFARACPKCGNTEDFVRRRSPLSWIRGLVGFLVGLPMREHHVWVCRKCGSRH